MKSLHQYIVEGGSSYDIIRKEWEKNKYPDLKASEMPDDDIDASKLAGIPDKRIDAIMSEIFTFRFGNIKSGNSTKMPYYNMFNARNILLFNYKNGDTLKKKFEKANIIYHIKDFTGDTDAGPIELWYLTEKGEKFLHDFGNR